MGLSLNELAPWNSSSVVLQTDGMREVVWLHDCMAFAGWGWAGWMRMTLWDRIIQKRRKTKRMRYVEWKI
jgi:hypothetical protein